MAGSSPLALFVSAPSHQRYSPAAGFHAGFVAPLADSLRAAMRPRLRAGCPLLGRCCVVGHCDERRAEHRDKNSSKKQTSHHVPPQMAVRVKSYIPKTGRCEIRNGGTENRRRLLAEMSHRIVFGFAAVAGSAHAALPSNITISQNRGDASAREPRTYHGRGFSLWPPSSTPVRPQAAWAKSDGTHFVARLVVRR